ncbi:hypothetical protein [Rhodospirillum centenum]|uniref:Uncharacterized protein n=1 Tax=Rhodospirillum centenum (strain ATCC 51521 / SW) TaxID=414684 RepID=B6IWF9_RHOCS|nr:hypothetical protein [Rhodospirillum centenum]ACJ00633.1 hypothetical protein RC1_3271 [Rhodospirillum centenum SW]
MAEQDDPGKALAAAREVARRLNDSLDELRAVLPVTGTGLAYMPEKFRTEADALLHRFRTLHGLLAGRVLPAAMGRAGLEARGKTTRELAGLLAGMRLVPDAEAFDHLTRLRDRLRDAFPVDPAEEAELLNAAARAVPHLTALLAGLETAAGSPGTDDGGTDGATTRAP